MAQLLQKFNESDLRAKPSPGERWPERPDEGM